MPIPISRWLVATAAALWSAAASAQPLEVTGRVLAGDGTGLVRASVEREALAKTMMLPATKRVLLAQSVGYPKP